jgi:hypothetical protein
VLLIRRGSGLCVGERDFQGTDTGSLVHELGVERGRNGGGGGGYRGFVLPLERGGERRREGRTGKLQPWFALASPRAQAGAAYLLLLRFFSGGKIFPLYRPQGFGFRFGISSQMALMPNGVRNKFGLKA